MKFVPYLTTILVLSISSFGSAGAPVDFVDANLEAAVEAQLGVSDPSPEDMLDLTTLHAQQAGISNLAGIEHAANLTELHLWENQISDISPLSQLGHLTDLYLWSNQIEDVSPLSGLNALTVLALPDNQIRDISALSGLTSLKQLYLYVNQITDTAPLSGLINLEDLYLYANQIMDVSPLSGLTKLTTLELGANQITNISALSGLTNLRALFLWENQIQEISGLTGLIHLQELYLHANRIRDISPLSELINLVKLHLWENQISDISPLSGLTHLAELASHENQIQDVSALSGLTNLQVLYLYVNQIDDISALSGLVNLTVLDLENNQIRDVSPLSWLENLTDIALGGNLITDVSPLVELSNWESLSLRGNPLNNDAYCTILHEIQSNTLYADYDPNPNPPENVTVSRTMHANEQKIAWGPVCSGPRYTSYYQVYRSPSPDGAKTAISDWQTETEFVDDTAATGISYYYWARAAANTEGSLGLTVYGAATPGPAGYVDLHDAGQGYRGFVPRVLYAGQNTEIYTRLANSGDNNSGPFTLDVYLSLDSHIDTSDLHLGQWAMGEIASEGVLDFREIMIIAATVPAGDYYVGWLVDQGNDVVESDETNNQAYVEGYQLTVSVPSTPIPTPNPMAWTIEPHAISVSSISMTATQATHVSGVEYLFDCLTEGGHDSAWQTDLTYIDSNLQPGTQYTYRVKARDRGQQMETNWSILKSAITEPAPDFTPPSPNPLTWAAVPYAVDQSVISMTASTATDTSGGVQYFFDCQSPGGHDSGWQTSSTYTDTGLQANTLYRYRVRARDSLDNQTNYSDALSATTSGPVKPLYVIGDTVLSSEAKIKIYDALGNGSIEYARESTIRARAQGPTDLAFAHLGRYMFTVSSGSAWIQIIDTVTMTVEGEAHVSGTKESFSAVAFDPVRNLVYSVDKGQDQLYVHQWDRANVSLSLIENGRITLSGTSTCDIALDLTNDLLFVSSGTNQIHVYSTVDWSLNRIITLGRKVERIDLDEPNQLLYAGTQVSGAPYLLQYDLLSTVQRTRKLGDDASVVGIAVDDSTSLAYVATRHPFYVVGSNQIHVLDSELNAIETEHVNGFVAGLGLPIDGITRSPLALSKRILSGAELIGGVHYVAGGDTLTYEICFENRSAAAVGNVRLIDELPAQAVYLNAELFDDGGDMLASYNPDVHTYEISMEVLGPNTRRCVLLTVRLKDGLAPGLTVINEATVDSIQTPQVAAQAECVVRYNSLGLTKRVVDNPKHFVRNGIYYVDRGALVTYEFCYRNDNAGPATNVVITDQLPEEVTWVGSEQDGGNGRYDASTHSYTWQYAQLDPNASDCLQITVLVHDDLQPGQQIINRVSIQSHEVAETWASVDVMTKYDPLNVNKRIVSGAQANPINGLPDLVFPGDTLVYSITVENPGSNPSVHNLAIVDRLPPELEFVSSPAAGVYDPIANTYELSMPTLDPNAVAHALLTVRLKDDLASGLTVINEIAVDSVQTPQVLAQAQCVVRRYSLTLNKRVVDDPSHFVINGIHYVDRGSLVTYEFCYENDNAGPATDVIIADHLPESVTWVGSDLDGGNGHYDASTHTYTWEYTQIDGNTSSCLQITVLVHENLLPGERITNRVAILSREVPETWASVDMFIKYDPLGITKSVSADAQANSADPLTLVFPGDTVSYRLSIENPASNPTVHNVSIIDQLPAELEYVSSPNVNGVLGLYDPNLHVLTWLYPALISTEMLTVSFEARVRLNVEPGSITNEAVVLGSEAPATMTRVHVAVDDAIGPPDAQADLTVYASAKVGGSFSDQLLGILVLGPQIRLSQVDRDTPLILNPGGTEASFQIVYGRDGKVVVDAYFDKADLVTIINDQNLETVTLRITGRYVTGEPFSGETTIPVTANLLLQE
jgi:internalin A